MTLANTCFSEITRAILEEMLQKVSTCSKLLFRVKNFLLLLLKSFTLNLFQFHICVFNYRGESKVFAGKKCSVQVAECCVHF